MARTIKKQKGIQLEYCARQPKKGRTWRMCEGRVYRADTVAEARDLVTRLNRGMPEYRFRISPVQPAGFWPEVTVWLEGKDVHVIRLALAAYVCDVDRMHTEGEQQARARELIERSEGW